MDECPCIIPDENFNCADCGKPINIPQIEPPDLGNMVGMCQLLDETAASCAPLLVANTDPKNPTLPRLRLIGGRMLRIPHKTFLKDLLEPSFDSAKALGYRGTLERWSEICLIHLADEDRGIGSHLPTAHS